MSDLKKHLLDLISVGGVAGHEIEARKLIEERWGPLVDEMQVSHLGSLEAKKRGYGAEPRKGILLAGHIDAIGLVVTGQDGSFLRFTSVGGVDPRVLPGQIVVVHGREELKGVIIQPPDRFIEGHKNGAPVGLEKLYVDIGLEKQHVREKVRPGDMISFGQPALELAGDVLTGHTMDDRTAVVAITHCLEILQKRIHDWDVWAVATVQEEVGLKGAFTSTFGLAPELGVAIDVTHAKGPGTSEKTIADLGKGVVLGMGPNVHPWMYRKMKEIAEDLEIPHQIEVMPLHSGTDAFALQIVSGGRPSMVLSIPLRYMHTPVETVKMKDIERVGRLLAEFITVIGNADIEGIRWEE